MKILVAGDFCQCDRVDKLLKHKRFEDVFGEIKPITSQADYSIINFEFPIVTDSTYAKPICKAGPNLKGTIESVDAIKYAGFNCCTIANNHILDQGEQCCLTTKNILENAGIDVIGAGKNLTDASAIHYKKIGGKILAVINCCEHEFSIATDTTAGANPLNPIQQYYMIQYARKNADYILIIVHGGHEHYQLPSPRMQETYRFFIDVGADAVINHHQHCYSGYESYKGKMIFYGLGNLCFDREGLVDTIWNKGYMVLLEFEESEEHKYTLIPYTQCNRQPRVEITDNTDDFYHDIERLNIIIKNKKLLKSETEKYFIRSSKNCIDRYRAYENRILNKLFRMHLFPSLVSTKKLLGIWNYIDCESHRDKQLFAFRYWRNNLVK